MDPHQIVKKFYMALSVVTFEAKNEIWHPLFLNDILPYLRKGDDRLIRLLPEDPTVEARTELAKAGFHPILITVINGQPPQVSDEVKELALDSLLDVCRGNEVARREFGGRGVIESLLPLIRHATMCTKALEALWMLCFDSPDNIARVLGRFRGRIGQALNEVLEIMGAKRVHMVTRMWAAALLHNLARDWYSSSRSGIHATRAYDGSPVRHKIASDDNLSNVLALLFQGPSKAPTPVDAKEGGPIPQAIGAWAAAALVKVIAVDLTVTQKMIKTGACEPLIGLLCGEDPLEQAQATKALSAMLSHFDAYQIIRTWFTANHENVPHLCKKTLVELSAAGVPSYDLRNKERKEVALALVQIFESTGVFSTEEISQCVIS